jgi:hypothetical protein
VSASNKAQLSNNNLVIIMVLITLLVVGATAIVTKALVTSIMRDTKVVAAKSKADKQLKDDLTAAPQLVQAFQGLGQTANTLADALPSTADLPGLLVLLENMSNDSGVSLKSVVPVAAATAGAGGAATTSTTTAPTTASVGATASSLAASGTSSGTAASGSATGGAAAVPQPYIFTLDFNGTYVGMLKLLGDLETSARPMRITGVQISGSGGALSGSVSVQTYFQGKAQWPFSTETIK